MPTSPLWAWPFAAVLLALATLPQLAPKLWARPRRRAGVLAALAAPTLAMLALGDRRALAHAATEYVGFMALLTALWGVTAGVIVDVRARPGLGTNLAWLAAGTLMASVLGTTGAMSVPAAR